jgi:predicted transcriptional regulator of viral defense system
MQAKEFIQLLTERNIHVFTISDAAKILRCPQSYAKLFLYRAAQKKLIGRVVRGIYFVAAKANEYEIASYVLPHSYISLVSALYYYGLTTQIPNKVYVVSTFRHPSIKNIAGFDIIFRNTNEKMMYGYHKEADGNISIADPEKAIVDIFYFKEVNDLDELALSKPSRVDIDRLIVYAKRSGRASVIARTAGLLRENGYVSQAKALLISGQVRR